MQPEKQKQSEKQNKAKKIVSKNETTQPGFLAHFLEGSTFWRAFWRTFGGGSTFWCTFGRFFPFFFPAPAPGKKSHFWSLFFRAKKAKKERKKRPKSATSYPAPEKLWKKRPKVRLPTRRRKKRRPKVRHLTRHQKRPLSSTNPTRPPNYPLCVACVFFGCFFIAIYFVFLVAFCFACAFLVALVVAFLFVFFFAFLVALCFAGAFLVCFVFFWFVKFIDF